MMFEITDSVKLLKKEECEYVCSGNEDVSQVILVTKLTVGEMRTWALSVKSSVIFVHFDIK